MSHPIATPSATVLNYAPPHAAPHLRWWATGTAGATGFFVFATLCTIAIAELGPRLADIFPAHPYAVLVGATLVLIVLAAVALVTLGSVLRRVYTVRLWAIVVALVGSLGVALFAAFATVMAIWAIFTMDPFDGWFVPVGGLWACVLGMSACATTLLFCLARHRASPEDTPPASVQMFLFRAGAITFILWTLIVCLVFPVSTLGMFYRDFRTSLPDITEWTLAVSAFYASHDAVVMATLAFGPVLAAAGFLLKAPAGKRRRREAIAATVLLLLALLGLALTVLPPALKLWTSLQEGDRGT